MLPRLLLLASSVPDWTTAIQSAVLRTQQQQSFRECKFVSLVPATLKVVSWSSSSGIVTLASNFRSNQLQAGDLGIQNTFNIPTNLSSSTYPSVSLPALQLLSLRCSKRHLLQVQRTQTAYDSRAFCVAVPLYRT